MSSLSVRAGGIKKIHTITITAGSWGAPGDRFTENFDMTSYGIVDYTKCLIYSYNGFLSDDTKFTSNTNLLITDYGNTVDGNTSTFQVVEYI